MSILFLQSPRIHKIHRIILDIGIPVPGLRVGRAAAGQASGLGLDAVRALEEVAGEVAAQDMWGIEIGTLIEVAEDFQAGIYHGWALRETRRADGSTITDKGDSQWNFSFIYRW
mgnify:CR=1 FL=1